MDYERAWTPYDHMRAYQEHDRAETTRLYEEAFGLPRTRHEYTSEQDGNTVIVFSTKVIIVTASGDVREYARA